MAATVQIVEKNGAPGTQTDKTSGTIRFKNADDSAVNTSNPMVKPVAGTDYSFEKWLRLNVTGGTYTEILNIVAYSDGALSLGAGFGIYAKAVASYATPAEATAITGYTAFASLTSGAPLSLGAGPYSGTGEKGDHLVMIMTVDNTAAGGVTATETLTLAWDEI